MENFTDQNIETETQEKFNLTELPDTIEYRPRGKSGIPNIDFKRIAVLEKQHIYIQKDLIDDEHCNAFTEVKAPYKESITNAINDLQGNIGTRLAFTRPLNGKVTIIFDGELTNHREYKKFIKSLSSKVKQIAEAGYKEKTTGRARQYYKDNTELCVSRAKQYYKDNTELCKKHQEKHQKKLRDKKRAEELPAKRTAEIATVDATKPSAEQTVRKLTEDAAKLTTGDAIELRAKQTVRKNTTKLRAKQTAIKLRAKQTAIKLRAKQTAIKLTEDATKLTTGDAIEFLADMLAFKEDKALAFEKDKALAFEKDKALAFEEDKTYIKKIQTRKAKLEKEFRNQEQEKIRVEKEGAVICETKSGRKVYRQKGLTEIQPMKKKEKEKKQDELNAIHDVLTLMLPKKRIRSDAEPKCTKKRRISQGI